MASTLVNLDYPPTKDLGQAKDTVLRFFRDRYNYNLRPELVDSEANTWISFGDEAYDKYVKWWDDPNRKPKANIIPPASSVENFAAPAQTALPGNIGFGSNLTSAPSTATAPFVAPGETDDTEETPLSIFGTEVSETAYYGIIAGGVLVLIGIAFLIWKKVK